MTNYQVLIRKQNVKFIYNLLTKLEIITEYEHFKLIVYDEVLCKSSQDKYIKSVYNAYTYLLLNVKTMLDSSLISKYYYLLYQKELDEQKVLKVVTSFYKPYVNDNIKRCINFLNQLLDIFNNELEKDKYIISLTLFNYSLAYFGYPPLTDIELKAYTEEELTKEISKEQRQPKSYYQNLTNITKEQIVKVLKEENEKLENEYYVNTLILFGSFSRDEQREDSDIDLLVMFKEGISYDEKTALINQMKERYKEIFKRNVDITELSNLVLDCYVKELQQYQIIKGEEK